MVDLEKMVDDVIRKYGFESHITVGFCKMVESYTIEPKTYKLNVIILTYEEIMCWQFLKKML